MFRMGHHGRNFSNYCFLENKILHGREDTLCALILLMVRPTLTVWFPSELYFASTKR